MSARRGSTALIALNGVILAGIAVVVLGLVYVLLVMPTLNRPEEAPPVLPAVEAYLDAVAGGDTAGALAMTELDKAAFHVTSTVLLDDEVLQAAQERISDAQVEDVEVSGSGGSSARTTVVYTLAGEQHETELRWDYDEDAEEWRVLNGLVGTLSADGLGGDVVPVEVAGVTPEPGEVCFEECQPMTSYALFVGVYPVRADLSGFEVHPDNTTPAELVVTVTPELPTSLSYLAVPAGKPWPVVNGNPTDPSP